MGEGRNEHRLSLLHQVSRVQLEALVSGDGAIVQSYSIIVEIFE